MNEDLHDDRSAHFDRLSERLQDTRARLDAFVFGQGLVVELVLACVLAGGHGLLVGPPGLAKTRLVTAAATALGLSSRRIQFTPDLMPSDILGAEVLDTAADGAKSFRFIEGPVFAQLVVADEINRASPRTQSALLEAMQEGQITVAGEVRQLPRPFHVLATQNPLEQEGTYPLPEAQLDRFLMQIDVAYPDMAAERAMLAATTMGADEPIGAVLAGGELAEAQALVRSMPIGEAVIDAVLRLVASGRPGGAHADDLEWSPGPRASQALSLTARARALLHGRTSPQLEDVRALALPVLQHRMSAAYRARSDERGVAEIVDAMVRTAL